MTLANDDLLQLKKHFFEWLAEAEAKRLPSAFAASALERISKRFDGMDQRFEFTNERLIRKEETLSSHIELTRKGFAVMEEHFNAVDKRFESMQVQMDKRFEVTQEQTNKRFDQVNKRFESMQVQMNKRFEATQEQMSRRFNEADKRFESMQTHMDKRFEATQEQINRRFDVVDQRFETMTLRMDKFMQWSFATMIATGSFVVAVLKLWPPVLP
jgi:DNA anti-recombination protein RmuC